MDINQIAQMAGVSRHGVVLSQRRPRLAGKVRRHPTPDRGTGYVRSRQAKVLRTGKTNVVGAVIPKINSASVSRMVAGIMSGGDSVQRKVKMSYEVISRNSTR